MNRRSLIVLLVGAGVVALITALVTLTRPNTVPEPEPAPPPRAAAPAPRVEPEPAPPPALAPAPRRTTPRPVTPAPEPAAPAPTTGELHIATDVPAQVFVDRVYLGAAPATASGLAPGPHQLNITAAGYDVRSETIEVSAGSRDIQIRFKEVRLDASIDVVHDHRVGSCTGRLVATPRGLIYETDNRNDGFSAPLTAVNGFAVDYLKKTLRLEVNRKTYTFTDPNGNADNLFVFHRDVDQARARLVAGDPPAPN